MKRAIIAAALLIPQQLAAGTLDDFFDAIMKDGVSVEAIQAEVSAEMARRGTAAVVLRPDLQLIYTARHFQDSSLPRPSLEAQGRPGAQLTFRLWDWGATAARIKSEDADIRIALEVARRKVNDVMLDSGTAAISLWVARMKVAFSDEALACSRVQSDIVTERRKRFITTEAAQRAIETEINLISSERRDAVADVAKHRAHLARWPDRKSNTPSLGPPTEVVAPEIRITLIEQERADLDLVAAVRGRWPVFEAVGSLDHTAGERYSDAVIGGRVKIDIFDQAGNNIKENQARSKSVLAAIKKRNLEVVLKSKLAVSEAAVIHSAAAARSSDESLAHEKKRFEDALAAFQAGKADPITVAQACRRISAVKRSKIEALARGLQAKLQRRADLGDLP